MSSFSGAYCPRVPDNLIRRWQWDRHIQVQSNFIAGAYTFFKVKQTHEYTHTVMMREGRTENQERVAGTHSNDGPWLILSIHKIISMDNSNNMLEFLCPTFSRSTVPTPWKVNNLVRRQKMQEIITNYCQKCVLTSSSVRVLLTP